MRPCTFVDTDAALRDLIAHLAHEPALALDTESNSFYVYFERVCLVQLSTEEADWAIDPFKVDLKALGPTLANPATELIIHAADYDIRCLKRDFGFTIGRLFDTMLAAKLLEYPSLGLAALLQKELGVTHAKEQQISDWGRRPLSASQLEYAYADTRNLLPLKRALEAALGAKNLTAEARKLFDRQAACEPRPKRFDPNDWREIKGARALDPVGKAVAKALFVLREDLARAWDRPPFKVFGTETILALAKSRPASPEALLETKGIGRSTLERAGPRILEAISAALPPAR